MRSFQRKYGVPDRQAQASASSVGRDGTGEPAIVVGLARDNAEAKACLPERLGGYPVIVKITGEIRSQ